jgi:ADP-dependent NAD(P)H-hydrate dehydratase / NAD(P)H-hydrate epimerase
MRTITGHQREPLHGTDATRSLERAAQAARPAHTLMARAGLAVARLARALTPHARCIWVACGPGNNGGDGLVAAMHLHRWAERTGLQVVVTHTLGAQVDAAQLPPDAAQALSDARSAGVLIQSDPPPSFDLAIDALLGIGVTRPLQGILATWAWMLRTTSASVLCVDLPSGLQADTGALTGLDAIEPRLAGVLRPGPRHTLSLLTLKPGLFTHQGRDAVGQVWFDHLDVEPADAAPVGAWLAGQETPAETARSRRAHASHKGSFGDVVVLGGQGIAAHGAGMTGAAVLAARAALHAGAGRVFVGLLEAGSPNETTWDPVCPELMFRRPAAVLDAAWLPQASVVCGCGGGTSVAEVLPRLLSSASTLVLDADALNAVATDEALQTQLAHRQGRGWVTVLTPHPLEAARLLGYGTAQIMADRLLAAQRIADRFQVVCVLKGSGTVVTAPREIARINPTGNAALSTAGTGDVLAGMVGAALAVPTGSPGEVLDRVCSAVFLHGWLADQWNGNGLVAGELARRVRPMA